MFKRIISAFLLAGAVIAPLSVSAASYVIERGDTLTAIAREFGVSIREIVERNGIADPNRIYAGDTLEIGSEDGLIGGAGGTYTPVTGYQSRLTTYISSSASTFPVASTRDKAGNQISIADISSSSTARVFFSLSTGTSKEEIASCTGVTASSWTGCVRGLSFQGGSMAASTTLAFAHNAGTSIIITDVGQFFTEFVSVTGDQTIFDRKTFYAFPIVTSTTALPTLGSELANKYYVDNVGAGGFTASNVSTTRGLSVDGSAPERVGINASTTRGLAFDDNGTANRPLYINASSTGGIGFHTDGAIQVDGSDNFTFSGNNVFSGNVTSTGSLRVPTPVISADATSLGYVDSVITAFTATGTASGAITAGRAVFATATSSVGQITTSTGTSTYSFIGIATASASDGATVTYTRPGGVNCNQSGLTPGVQYYLNGTAGQIATTPGTAVGRVGLALSATCVQVMMPKYRATGTFTVSATGNTTVTTNFYPGAVRVRAAYDSGNGLMSVGDDSNRCVFSAAGNVAVYAGYNASAAVYLYDGTTVRQTGTISAKSATGFTYNSSVNTGNNIIQWEAESL